MQDLKQLFAAATIAEQLSASRNKKITITVRSGGIYVEGALFLPDKKVGMTLFVGIDYLDTRRPLEAVRTIDLALNNAWKEQKSEDFVELSFRSWNDVRMYHANRPRFFRH